MRILVAALAAALLAGCSSPSDLMSSPANLTVTTSKSAKAYALCVFPEWQEHSTATVMSETANGYRIVNGFGLQTDDVLDITNAYAGAVGELYQRVAWSQLGRSSLRDSMQKCR